MKAQPESIILGCRDFENDIPLRSYIGNTISKVVYRWVSGIRLSDTQTGLRGLPFGFLPFAMSCSGERYEYETNMLLCMIDNGFDVREIEINTVYDDNNSSSHFNPIKDSIMIYSVIFKYSFSSIITAIIDYLVFAVEIYLGIPILISTYISRFIACIFNFTINKNIVFREKGNTILQFVKYILLVALSGTISAFLVSGLGKIMPMISPIAIKIPVETFLWFFNYAIQRSFIFRNAK